MRSNGPPLRCCPQLRERFRGHSRVLEAHGFLYRSTHSTTRPAHPLHSHHAASPLHQHPSLLFRRDSPSSQRLTILHLEPLTARHRNQDHRPPARAPLRTAPQVLHFTAHV